MFSTEEFIEASRDFVCIRIETYENEEAEQLVKKVLNGKYANTSFVILNPQGTERLTRSGRSPSMAMSNDRGKTDRTGRENPEIIGKMQQIASQFKPRRNSSDAELQDFHSLRQALNCASADQRLLVFVNAPEKDRTQVEQNLKSVFTDDEVIGKFHLDFADADTDQDWTTLIHRVTNKPGIVVVRSGQFGVEGRALDQLSLDEDPDTIIRALLDANEQFAKVEKRKNYEQHVQEGRREGIYFENEISRRNSEDSDGNRRRKGKRRRRGQ